MARVPPHSNRAKQSGPLAAHRHTRGLNNVEPVLSVEDFEMLRRVTRKLATSRHATAIENMLAILATSVRPNELKALEHRQLHADAGKHNIWPVVQKDERPGAARSGAERQVILSPEASLLLGSAHHMRRSEEAPWLTDEGHSEEAA